MKKGILRLAAALACLALAGAGRPAPAADESPRPEGVPSPYRLVWRNLQTHELRSWWLDGAAMTVQALPVEAPDDPLWRVAAVGDLLGTGQDGILFRHATTRQFMQYAYDPLANSFQKAEPAGWPAFVGPGWRVLGAAPFERPGPKAGLLLQHATSHELAGLSTQPPYTWHPVAQNPTGQWEVVVFFGEGILLRDRNSGLLRIWHLGETGEGGPEVGVQAQMDVASPGPEWEPLGMLALPEGENPEELQGTVLGLYFRHVIHHGVQVCLYKPLLGRLIVDRRLDVSPAAARIWAFQPER